MAQQIGNSELLRTWANDGTVVVPADAKIDEGWLRGEQPPHEWMNYIHNVLGQKVNHALSRGAPDWNATTQYNAGAVVNNTGEIWVALTTNTNSQPDKNNTDWTIVFNSQNIGAKDPTVLTVGPAGDFVSINAAVRELVLSRPVFSANEDRVARVTLELKTGFVMEEQLIIDGLNLSWISIVSEASEVMIARSALTRELAPGELGGDAIPAFGVVRGGVLPVIGALFNMDSTGSGAGREFLRASQSSLAVVSPGAGCKNAAGRAIVADAGSVVTAREAIAEGAGGIAFGAAGASLMAARGASARFSASGFVSETGSTMEANLTDARDVTGGSAYLARNAGTIHASEANASDPDTRSFLSRTGGIINAQDANATGGTVEVQNGGIINANGVSGAASYNIALNTLTASGIIFRS